jgi:hypothetical protein
MRWCNLKVQNRIFLLFFLILMAVAFGGCNLPGESTPIELSPGAVYTFAAQTIIAQITQDAPTAPADLAGEITDTVSPVPEPVDTVEVIPTLEYTQPQEPTATQTQTETPSRTAIPDIILEDDFSNPNLWYTYEDDDYIFEYNNDAYRIYNNVLNAAYWSVRSMTYGDIRLEVDVTRKAGPQDGYFGVLCRFGDEGKDYYSLVISDNGFFGILKMDNGEKDFLGSGVDDDGVIHRGQGETNRIQGVCFGERLILYVNDQQLLEVFDDDFSSGDIGLVAGNRLSDTGIDVLFDNFVMVWP